MMEIEKDELIYELSSTVKKRYFLIFVDQH